MAGKFVKQESVVEFNSTLFREINEVVGHVPTTRELMKINIKSMIKSFSNRNCDVNKKKFFETCLENV